MCAVRIWFVCGLAIVVAAAGQCDGDEGCAVEKDRESLLQSVIKTHEGESDAMGADAEFLAWGKKQMDAYVPYSRWAKKARCETKPSWCSLITDEAGCKSNVGVYWGVRNTPAHTYCHWESQLGLCISRMTWCEVVNFGPDKSKSKSMCQGENSALSNSYMDLKSGMKKDEGAKAKHVCQWQRGPQDCPVTLCQQICKRGQELCGPDACDEFGKCFKEIVVTDGIHHSLNLCFTKIQGICASSDSLLEEGATANHSKTSQLEERTLDESLETKKTCG